MPSLKGPFKTLLRQALIILLVSSALGLAVNQLRPDGIPILEQDTPESGTSSGDDRGLSLSLADAGALHESGEAIFLDARPKDWFEAGHIKDARNLPAERVEELYEEVLKGVPEDAPIITYCDGESCDLSHELAWELMIRGYTNVHVLINGWTLWNEAGLPVEKGGGS